MFKPGKFYLTTKGQLVKIFSQFQFQDGFVFNAAIFSVSSGWSAVRYNPAGVCNINNDKNVIINFEPFEKYKNYSTFLVWFDRTTSKWIGQAKDAIGNVIVTITHLDDEHRAMNLIQLGCEEKLLSWMREAGYEDETKELI